MEDATIRYQGAVIRDDRVLLIMHRDPQTGRTYWILPGGGKEAGETDEETVCREMREEICCEVSVERLLLHRAHPLKTNRWHRTFRCTIVSGEPKPGIEPEEEGEWRNRIVEVRWFDLRQPKLWEALARNDEITYPQLIAIRQALGYDWEE